MARPRGAFCTGERSIPERCRYNKTVDSLVLANITERPTRAVTSILGIALGVVLIVVTVGLARGMLHSSGRREGNIGAELLFQPPGSFGAAVTTTPLSLPVAYTRALSQIEGVQAVTPVGRYVRSGAGGIGFELIEGIAIHPTASFAGYADITGIQIVEGREISETNQEDNEIIIDRQRARDHNMGVGSTLELLGRTYSVVGIYEPEVGARIKMRLRGMQDLLGTAAKCSWILIKTESPEIQEAVGRRIEEKFPGNQIIFTRDIPGFYDKGIPTLDVFLQVVVGLATVISVLIILLAMHTAVTERTREIGILKSLGASKRFIVGVVEAEALLISALGVLVGLGLAAGTRHGITSFTSLVVEFEAKWIAIATAVGVLGGIAGALYPALHAAGQDPVKALAYE
jgi:putative ABC transport system permease protein